MIASLAATPPRAHFEVDYRNWVLEPGFDAADFAVGLTEHVHRRVLPALAAHGGEDTARGFELRYAADQAVLLWRALGKEDEAVRVEAQLRAPPALDEELPVLERTRTRALAHGKTPVRSTIKSATCDDITHTPPASGSTA